MLCLQATKANGIRALFEAAGKKCIRRTISHIAVFAEVWNTQGKSLKAQVICINLAKQDQGQYLPLKKLKDLVSDIRDGLGSYG